MYYMNDHCTLLESAQAEKGGCTDCSLAAKVRTFADAVAHVLPLQCDENECNARPKVLPNW